MSYYLDTIEQIHTEEEGKYTEYGKREKKGTYQEALTAFYTKLTNVSNSDTHVWLDIKIVNSKGGIEKKDSIGAYVATTPVTPETTPTE
jgi:hypothetical protein